MNGNHMTTLLWKRLAYNLSPQFDIYQHLGKRLKGKVVLEVGFGTGLGVMQYADDAERVVAIDIDEAATDFASRVFPVHKVQWYQADILTIGNLDADHYDYVVMIEVLEHVEDPRRALKKVKSALKPGGRALITVPNRLRSRYKPPDDENQWEWSPQQFFDFLQEHFLIVTLLDYKLAPYGDPLNFETPIIAEVTRGS